jgi:Flp pilus assembly protein TadD
MVFSTGLVKIKSHFPFILFAALILVAHPSLAEAQGSVDYTGTGGSNTIQGRIYFPSGHGADAPGLKIRLEATTAGNLTVLADSNGTFSFKNLAGGSYTIVIEETADYAPVREPVYIDDPGSSNMRGRTVVGNMPRIFIVPIHLLFKGRVERRAGVIDAALAAVPKAASNLYFQALESARAGDNKEAIKQLKSAIALYPEFPLALNELGVQYLKVGQPDRAAEVLATAVRIAPEGLLPRLHYGIALLNQRKFVNAEEQLRVVLQKNPATPTAHMYLGISLISQKRLDEAQKELLIATGSNSSEVARAHWYLGGIYWAKRDYRTAADQLEIYLKLIPKAADAERTRGVIKELRGKQK